MSGNVRGAEQMISCFRGFGVSGFRGCIFWVAAWTIKTVTVRWLRIATDNQRPGLYRV